MHYFSAPCKHTLCCAHNLESSAWRTPVCVYVFTGTTHERDCVCHYEILKVGVFALSDRPATANGAVRVCMCVCVSHEMRHFMAGAASQHRALSVSEREAYPLNYLRLASACWLSRLLSRPSFRSGLFLSEDSLPRAAASPGGFTEWIPGGFRGRYDWIWISVWTWVICMPNGVLCLGPFSALFLKKKRYKTDRSDFSQDELLLTSHDRVSWHIFRAERVLTPHYAVKSHGETTCNANVLLQNKACCNIIHILIFGH